MPIEQVGISGTYPFSFCKYNESNGHAGRTSYRHVVYHLVALSGDQNCKETGATVFKQVPVGGF